MLTSDPDCDALVEKTCKVIFARRMLQPKVAIVLGSGLGGLAECVDRAEAIPYADLPCFPCTHAPGHSGRLITGYLAGLPVAMMQGRAHRYEGLTDTEVSLPIHCLNALGASTLIVTNAAVD